MHERIIYEDNHYIAVNKHCGELVQPDPSGEPALVDALKAYIAQRDAKPGRVFLEAAHRIDRPVSGVVLLAKTSKGLSRINELFRQNALSKTYWAVVQQLPPQEAGMLEHYLRRDTRKNRTVALSKPAPDAKLAQLRYRVVGSTQRYHLLEVELITGRHHQIRCQLAQIGCHIKGDLKYGAARSNPNGGISLHSRCLSFEHPVAHTPVRIVAPPPPDDPLWAEFLSIAASEQ